MSRQTTLKGNPFDLLGAELAPGDAAPDFSLTGTDLGTVTLSDTGGVRVINVVPSLDTPVCDEQIRRFNTEAAGLGDVSVLCVSCDLPFAQKRWCGAAGAENVRVLSDHKEMAFAHAYGTWVKELRLNHRAVFVIDKKDKVTYVQYLDELTDHPDYDRALAAVKELQ